VTFQANAVVPKRVIKLKSRSPSATTRTVAAITRKFPLPVEEGENHAEQEDQDQEVPMS
jgi:hypothetical protein